MNVGGGKLVRPGMNPTKKFLCKTKIFFYFFLLRLAISKHRKYLLMVQTLKLNYENWKNEEIKVW
jgi:hypothetical protein